MKNPFKPYFFLALFTGLFFNACAPEEEQVYIAIQNPSTLDRNAETVSIAITRLRKLTEYYEFDDLLVKDAESGKVLVRQLLDNNQDGQPDELLFQVNVPANAEKAYLIVGAEDGASQQPESELTTYSRFVPERTDDYTWENDRVAFRTYGPVAQRMIEENEPGGTLSSGIDLWLKRVSYSIINDWYAKNLDTAGYYHIDHGEGYDPYHVGKSRGTGGIGVWLNDSLHVSKNFTAFRTLATGPLRTVFELDYAPWSDFGIHETKRLSLDLGSNFSKFEIALKADSLPPNYTIGLTLHQGAGEVSLNEKEGWFRHWEPIDDSFVGEGIVIDPAQIEQALKHESSTPDQSQILIVTKPSTSPLTYYAGFGWQKSGQVNTVGDWDAMVKRQAELIKNPLKVLIKE